MKTILDACCGSKMFWHNKNHPKVVYVDNRMGDEVLCDGRTIKIAPDIVADFRAMPFDDKSFNIVIFDPPHLLRAGKSSWLLKKYGKLEKNTWQQDLKEGFDECMRVLKPNGTLIFKWSEIHISKNNLLGIIGVEPLITHSKDKTHFFVFMKGVNNDI